MTSSVKHREICGDPENPKKVTLIIPETIDFEGNECKLIGYGTYNDVYEYYDKNNNNIRMVIKIQRGCDQAGITHPKEQLKLDSPERSVRLWNGLNSDLSLKAKVVSIGSKKAWTCPFIESCGIKPNPQEMREAIIKIFNMTGRILIDAACGNNLIKTRDGKIVCVDIGLILQLEKRKHIPFNENRLMRSRSDISLVQEKMVLTRYIKYFEELAHKKIMPKSIVDLLKALIIIKQKKPDLINVDFLKNDLDFTTDLAMVYESSLLHFSDEDKNNDTIKLNHELGEKLRDAATKGNTIVVQALAEQKVNVDQPTKWGWTALFYAIQNGNVVMLDLLLQHGADVNKTLPNGLTPLMFAASKGRGYEELVRRLLLQPQIHVNQSMNVNGCAWTALLLAAKNGDVEIMDILLQHGAKVDRKTEVDRQQTQPALPEPLVKGGLLNAGFFPEVKIERAVALPQAMPCLPNLNNNPQK